ncbi:MAG: DUF1449 family protein, partial [Myxococcales bacterium]|nr:DUF1449 family protein [Myxococcales bacterium]
GEGAGEGLGEGAGEASAGLAGGVVGLLAALKLRSAPMTVVLSTIILSAFCFSYLGMFYLGDVLPFPGLLVGVGAFVLAVPLTSILVRPLGRIFRPQTGRKRAEVVGHTAAITTGRVDWSFGQADARVGNDHLLIQVRCDPTKGLRRHQEVLIIDYDTKREAYIVEPLGDDD